MVVASQNVDMYFLIKNTKYIISYFFLSNATQTNLQIKNVV